MTKNSISATVEKDVLKDLENTRTEITKQLLNDGRDTKTLPSRSELVEKAIETSPLMDYELYNKLKKEHEEFNQNKLEKVGFGEFVRHRLEESLED